MGVLTLVAPIELFPTAQLEASPGGSIGLINTVFVTMTVPVDVITDTPVVVMVDPLETTVLV